MAAHLFHHLVPALITPLSPFIRDSFSLDYTKWGILISAFNIVYGASQLPTGWLADRFGYRTMIAVGISGAAGFGFLSGFSPGFLTLAVFLGFMGLMGGGYHPSASPLISSAVDERRRGRALGIHQIGGSASFFVAPPIAVWVARMLGWRGTLISLTVPIMVYGLVLFALLRGWGLGGTGSGKGSGRETTEEEGHEGKARNLAPVILLNALVQILVYSTVGFIMFFVVDHFGGSRETAALMLSLTHMAGIWAGPAGGFLSDRIGRVPILVFTALITGPLLFLLTRVTMGVPLALVLTFAGMAMYMSMPVTELYVIGHSPKGRRSTILGIYYMASRGGPGLMAPALGKMIDKLGFNIAFSLIGLLMALAAVCCSAVIVWNEYRKT